MLERGRTPAHQGRRTQIWTARTAAPAVACGRPHPAGRCDRGPSSDRSPRPLVRPRTPVPRATVAPAPAFDRRRRSHRLEATDPLRTAPTRETSRSERPSGGVGLHRAACSPVSAPKIAWRPQSLGVGPVPTAAARTAVPRQRAVLGITSKSEPARFSCKTAERRANPDRSLRKCPSSIASPGSPRRPLALGLTTRSFSRRFSVLTRADGFLSDF